ncbi:MAG: spore coat protein [Dehalococcoidia bacterium]|nr:spore coat protein [Dehalococcoidia bacterium]
MVGTDSVRPAGFRRWRYRVLQFAKAFSRGLSTAEQAEAANVLSPALYAAFRHMKPGAQRHAFDVYSRLRQQGWDDADLLSAGLLHDVAKGRLHVIHRVAWVLLGAASVSLRSWLARATPLGAVLGLRVNYVHAEASAQQVQAAGGSHELVKLIREHYRVAPGDPRLCALQQADDDN